jgi:hypothetical protein
MKLDRFTLLCNGAGAFLALVIGGYFVSSLVYKERPPSCGHGYAMTATLPLETNSGELMSTIELQARAGRREYGLLENARVIRAGDVPTSAVLEISLGGAAVGARNGIGLQWSPPALAEAHAACLSYMIWLADDFDFGSGGILPGLFGGRDQEDLAHPDGAGFASRLAWRSAGALESLAQLPSGAPGGESRERDRMTLPRGRWVGIEQELRLNRPGQADGELRVWIDGELILERRAVAWRRETATPLGGVVAMVGHGSLERAAGARRASTLRLTPLELRWQ